MDRGFLSQNILGHLRNFVEYVTIKAVSNGRDVDPNDYKTNKDLYKNFRGERMLYPFNELLNCSFNVYQLQLSLYQLALEFIGFKVIGRRIIWLKDDSSYEKINTNSYTYNLYYALINKATN